MRVIGFITADNKLELESFTSRRQDISCMQMLVLFMVDHVLIQLIMAMYFVFLSCRRNYPYLYLKSINYPQWYIFEFVHWKIQNKYLHYIDSHFTMICGKQFQTTLHFLEVCY